MGIPAPRGTGIVSAPVPKKLLQMAGIEDCYTSARGSTGTLGNFAKATYAAIAKTYSYLTASSSRKTSNSPLKRGSLLMSILYLSILSSSRLTPGTVSTRPSKDAASWNSLKRQAAAQPVVERDRPTWQLTMTGVVMAVPSSAWERVSKSASRGAAELQTGMRLWVGPGKVFLTSSMTS